MKNKLVKFSIITLGVFALLHTLICFFTSYFIENSIKALPDTLKLTEDPVLKDLKISYLSESSGIYSRQGSLVIEHPLIIKSIVPIRINSGFLYTSINAKFDDLLNHLVGHNFIVPALTGKRSVAFVNVNASVLSLSTSADLLIHAPYKLLKNKNLDIKAHVNIGLSQNPSFDVSIKNYINSNVANIESLDYTGNIEGIAPISSFGQGIIDIKNLIFEKKHFNKLNISYICENTKESNIFNLKAQIKGQGALEYLNNFDFSGKALSFNKDRILNTKNYKKSEKDKDSDIILNDLHEILLDSSSFSISKSFANKVLSEASSELTLHSTGKFDFKYPKISDTLTGHINLSTNTHKGIAHLMDKQKDGSYAVVLKIINGEYYIGDIALGPDLLKSITILALFKKIKLGNKLKSGSDTVGKEFDSINKSVKKLFK